MYKAMGDDSAFRDGVFSHAAPRQGYQAGQRSFADGSLGAFSRMASTQGRHGGTRAPRLHPRGMTGIGSAAFRDGSLGQAFRDGSLGDAASDAITAAAASASQQSYDSTIGPLVIQTIDQRTKQEWFKLPQNQAVVAGLVVLTGAVVYLFVKR